MTILLLVRQLREALFASRYWCVMTTPSMRRVSVFYFIY